jgi:hypothetical protein
MHAEYVRVGDHPHPRRPRPRGHRPFVHDSPVPVRPPAIELLAACLRCCAFACTQPCLGRAARAHAPCWWARCCGRRGLRVQPAARCVVELFRCVCVCVCVLSFTLMICSQCWQGWEERRDARTNRVYYINHVTRSTQWDRPLPLVRLFLIIISSLYRLISLSFLFFFLLAEHAIWP